MKCSRCGRIINDNTCFVSDKSIICNTCFKIEQIKDSRDWEDEEESGGEE